MLMYCRESKEFHLHFLNEDMSALAILFDHPLEVPYHCGMVPSGLEEVRSLAMAGDRWASCRFFEMSPVRWDFHGFPVRRSAEKIRGSPEKPHMLGFFQRNIFENHNIYLWKGLWTSKVRLKFKPVCLKPPGLCGWCEENPTGEGLGQAPMLASSPLENHRGRTGQSPWYFSGTLW